MTGSACRGCLSCSSAATPTTPRARTAFPTTSRTVSSTPGPTTTTPRRGFYESLQGGRRARFDRDLRDAPRVAECQEPWWAVIELALRSPARVAVLQAQDVLGLGSQARMNDPSRRGGNWRWRLEPGALTRPAGAAPTRADGGHRPRRLSRLSPAGRPGRAALSGAGGRCGAGVKRRSGEPDAQRLRRRRPRCTRCADRGHQHPGSVRPARGRYAELPRAGGLQHGQTAAAGGPHGDEQVGVTSARTQGDHERPTALGRGSAAPVPAATGAARDSW